MPLVTVWPHAKIPGWAGEDSVDHLPACDTVDLVEALDRRWSSDAHFVPYHVVGPDGGPAGQIPRLNIGCLPALHALGARRVFTAMVMDVDDKANHAAGSPAKIEWRAEQQERVRGLPAEMRAGLGQYDTRGGYRLLWILPRGIDADSFMALRAALLPALREHGIDPDDFKDWNRCYRLPRVVRDGRPQDRDHDWSGLGPMHWTPPAAAQAERRFAGLGAARVPAGPLPSEITENRNMTLTSLAGRLRRAGLGAEEILETLLVTNERRCKPPMDVAEVEHIARGTMRYAVPGEAPPALSEQKELVVDQPLTETVGAITPAQDLPALAMRDPGAPFTPEALALAADLYTDAPDAFARLRAELKGSVNLHDWASAVRRTARTRRATGQAAHDFPLKLGSEAEIAEYVCKTLEGDGPAIVADLGAVWRYEPASGLWAEIPADALQRQVVALDGVLLPAAEDKMVPLRVGARMTRDVAGLCAVIRRVEDFFGSAPEGVAFRDVFLGVASDFRTLETRPAGPEHRARWALPFPWAPDAKAPRWDRYLREVFQGEADAEDRIRLLAQFVGACLFGVAPRFERVVMLAGGGENGKSVTLTAVSALFPPEARSAIPPQDFGDDNKGAALAGKRLNVVNELPDSEILAGETFKAIVTGDEITRRRAYEQTLTFRSRAGHLFAANRLPGSSDKSWGFWRRWIVVEFNRRFTAADREPGLGDWIVANELPGIAAWAVRGAADLLSDGNYNVPESSRRVLSRWQLSSDPLMLFLSDCTAPAHGEDPWVSATELYVAYTGWCTANGYRAMSSGHMGERLQIAGVSRRRSNGSKFALRLRPRTEWGKVDLPVEAVVH